MRGSWIDIDRAFAESELFRRQIDALFGGPSTRPVVRGQGAWNSLPEPSLLDEGSEYVITAEVPGLSPEEVALDATASGITISGQRKNSAPEGYTAHRIERSSFRFARTLTFPVKVDPDRVSAEVKSGVLTVRVPKSTELQPRRVTVAG